MPVYADQGGGALLMKEGAILGGDLTTAKARLLLMLALPNVKGDHKKLVEIFNR
jgi:L-asparaginase/Glu-tRNA(Gln) amidotransferase subunit D